MLFDRRTGVRVHAPQQNGRTHAIDHKPGSTRGATRHTTGSAGYVPPRGSKRVTRTRKVGHEGSRRRERVR